MAAKVATGVPQSNVRVALLGLAFKPDIDDLRESPALQIARNFAARSDAQLMLVEPNIEMLPEAMSATSLVTLEHALATADVIAVLVRHARFAEVASALRAHPRLIDAVGLLAP